MATESLGVVRVTRQVLLTILTNVTLGIPGVARIAQGSQQRSPFSGRDIPRNGIALSIQDNALSTDLYIVVAPGVNIVEVGSTIQEEVASAIEEMVGMRVQEVNVYIQDVAE